MHTSSYIATLALAATAALGAPSPAPPAASGVAPAAAKTNNSIHDWSGKGTWYGKGGWYGEGGRPGGRPGHGRPGRPGWDGGQPGEGSDDDSNAGGEQQTCMSRADALKTATTFQSLIQGYTVEQALAALTPDFVDYSSAVSIIINRGGSGPEDVTAPIFTSREEFMQGHGTQEPIPFETLKVWATCDGVVSMVWRSIRSGQGQDDESAAVPVTGVAVLETEPTEWSEGEELERARAGGYNYRIHTLWSEFNTAAWLVNNGVFETEEDVPLIPPPEEETTPSPPSTIQKRGKRSTKFEVGLA